MKNLKLDSFSVEELKELIHQQQDELEYQEKTVELFHQENKTLKKELYNLAPRVNRLETLSKEIELILNTKQQCRTKISQLKQVVGCVGL
ncbi:MAG: hypothetical protein KO253_04530 [Methanobrevibacter arboriphilus]|nr:hypothetical protein [Methanobrevibacter arboriphilus]